MDKEIRKTWDTISDSWTNLRVKPEEEILKFSKKSENGIVVDLGCGNCRNLVPFKGKTLVGIDFSKSMIREAKKYCKKNGLEVSFIIAEVSKLPLKNKIANTIIYASTISTIKEKSDRIKSLEEIKRVGKDGFKMILSIWNRWQKRFFWKLFKSFISGKYPNIHVEWNYHGTICKRFYHLYTTREMKKEIIGAGLKIEKISRSKGNVWFWVKG